MILKSDIVLICCIAIFTAIFIILLPQKATGDTVVVNVGGNVFATYPLDEDGTYKIQTGSSYNEFQISDGKVKMVDANCPDKVCLREKEIDSANEAIICLPNKVVIEIKSSSSENNSNDAIVW